LTSQSFSYQVSGFSISADIVNIGSSTITFNNESYQATNYQVSLSATNSTGGDSISANGTLTSLPSGLINSAQFLINGTTSINAQLLSTDLPLTAPASDVNTVGASLLVAGVLVAIAIAVPAVFKIRKHHNLSNSASDDKTEETQQCGKEEKSDSEEKPSYWVD
jgi:hypothetical protein